MRFARVADQCLIVLPLDPIGDRCGYRVDFFEILFRYKTGTLRALE